MPRTSAHRAGRVSPARRPFAVFAFLAAAAWAVLGFAPFSPQVVNSQGEPSAARSLSVAERVMHQRAVEEVYWRHTSWPQENSTAKPSLDEVLTTEQTAAKVEDTLRKSEALARHFGRPVAPEQLQAEVARMARETKRPAVLRELFAALNNDPFVIAEVLARPALVNRLALNSFEADERSKATGEAASEATDEAASFDAWWATAAGEFVSEAPAATDFNYQLAEINQAATRVDDTWSPMQALPVATGTAVWTGAEVVVWGGLTQYGGRTNSGARYNPATDTWSPTSTVNAPRERSGNAAYWTGTEMLIWGGTHGSICSGDGPCRSNSANTGGRYNPLTDTWTPTSISGAPFTSGLTVWTGSKLLVWGSGIHTYDPSSDTWRTTTPNNSPAAGVQRAVWTGAELFVWGDADNSTGKRGGIYNPETNTWRQPNTLNAPSNRNNFSMVWTGREVVVWGGYEGNFVTLNTGGRYNPATDTWTPTSTANAPAGRYGHVAVWTGAEMVIHGGDLRPGGQMSLTNTGARYNPASDSWTPTQTTKSPIKFAHVAVWTGTEVFVWGGSTGTGSFQKEGARYNPSNDSWTPVNNNDSPLYLDRGVWTGAEMLVWGYNSLCYACSMGDGSVGARYDPATNVWRPMNLSGAPVPYVSGYGTNALWTGKEMLVWGGGRGRYNPLTDTWSAISNVNAPASGFTAVWSGKEMIVWGSETQENSNTGGRYNPETDTWRPTSTVGAPVGRSMHTAVWAGTEMVVWGGVQFGVMGKLNTGGRYDPETDAWRPTSTAGAPEGRTYHTAVWTGSEMIIWGGSNATEGGGNASLVNTGARYNPASDTWTPTGTVGAPEARSDHRAVWTGSQMIVWGGAVKGVTGPTGTYTGARYNPSTDVWTPTSTLRAPSKRMRHVQVWTGTQMIVWGGIASEGAATHGAIYNAPGASPEGNLPPSVRLTSPAGGTNFQSGDAVRLAVEVSDPDGAVTTVRFYANDQLVATDTQAPFEFDWEARGGNFALTATATDDGNAEARSASVNITVAPSTAPPVCTLTAPADGSTYAYGASVRMEATATANRDRSIARVEFLDNGTVVTYYEPPTYNAPWVYTYLAPASGVHSLTARCTDNAGGVTTSAPKVVTVDEQGFSVSGQLLDDRGFIISGVRLRLDGPAGTAPRYATTTVAGNGNYHFGGLKAGETYTVTPEPGQWRFSPESNTYTAISKSWTLQHFYGVRAGHAISGRLTDANGNPVYPATVNMSGSKNATTNVLFDGTYIFYNLAPGGTYTVQPYKNGYVFEPGFRTFENLSSEQTADFTGAPQGTVYTVSGRVVDYKGLPVAGLRIRLGTVLVNGVYYRTTDADGRFTFDNIAAGENVQLAPEDFTYKYTYAPTSHSYYGISQNVTNADFVATPATNIALAKTATQSSTGWGGVAARAVDGVTNGNWSQNSMTTTFNDAQAWWEVDLGAVSDIAAVRVWNRTDCCYDRLRDFYVIVSDVPFTSTDLTATLNQAGVSGYRVTGPVSPSVMQAVGRTGRYVRVQLSGTDYLSLPEVEVLGREIKPTQPANIALNKAATQSSTGWGGVASRAVDGNTSGDWAKNSMTTTFSESQAWWEVDLGSSQQINTVKVFNRTDCCTDRLSNFHVLVSDVPFTSKSLADTLAQTGVSGYHTAGAAGRPTSVNVNRVGRYVRVQLAGANYLSLAEVEVWGEQAAPTTPAVNLSQGKTATQSSTGWGGVASRAVDGNTSGDWAKNSVTTTFSDAQAWWEVDLGTVRSIQDVKLWNRTDCCTERLSDFYVIVSDVPFTSQNLTTTLSQTGVAAFRKTGAAGAQTSIAVGRTGRYVRVQLTGTNYLSLAEVQVMGQ